MQETRFLTKDLAEKILREYGSPLYVYSEKELVLAAEKTLSFKTPFGCTVRFAMKANPNKAILKIFDSKTLFIDASSGYEAERAIHAGIDPKKILLTSQEIPQNISELLKKGIEFNACSLFQLQTVAPLLTGKSISVRINPGAGSGGHAKTNVGGELSSFGIWHEHIPEIKHILSEYNVSMKRVHTHIGSGSDPDEWARVAEVSMSLLNQFPSVTHLNLGGGFKVARVEGENETDMEDISKKISQLLEAYSLKTERNIHLEIEPGTFLMAHAGAILSTVVDVVDTGKNGYNFIKLDIGMTEILRPTLYGSEHPITIFHKTPRSHTRKYIVVGHCCESGDLLTPVRGKGDEPLPRTFLETEPGDSAVIDGTGAYCASMSAVNYNSFPKIAEVMIRIDGQIELIRRREALKEELILENLPE